MSDPMASLNNLVRMQTEDIRKERDALADALQNMTANFRMALLLVNDADTRRLGLDLVADAQKLLKRCGK